MSIDTEWNAYVQVLAAEIWKHDRDPNAVLDLVPSQFKVRALISGDPGSGEYYTKVATPEHLANHSPGELARVFVDGWLKAVAAARGQAS